MNIASRPKLVFLGMMSRFPVSGAIWGTMHYLIGFQRLGFEVYYVEAHGCTPRNFVDPGANDGWANAAAFIDRVMRRFDLGDRWAYDPLYSDNLHFGMSRGEVARLYADAALIINYHGGTVPLPEHYAKGRLIYLETDPVELQIELHNNDQNTIQFLEPHSAFFTWGLNYHNPDCKLPLPERFHFKPSCPAIVQDLWWPNDGGSRELFTTIGNWRQVHRQVHFQGETYHWNKEYEFQKIIDLPSRTPQKFELALSSYEPADQAMLEEKGWLVRSSQAISDDVDAYRHYIAQSRGEFTVAKDQNIRLRTGWFSERSAQYLAAGRPVITQDTGFGNVLPTGCGLFGFSKMDEILAAVETINADCDENSRAAREIARDYFNYDVVLGKMLAELGASPST